MTRLTLIAKRAGFLFSSSEGVQTGRNCRESRKDFMQVYVLYICMDIVYLIYFGQIFIPLYASAVVIISKQDMIYSHIKSMQYGDLSSRLPRSQTHCATGRVSATRFQTWIIRGHHYHQQLKQQTNTDTKCIDWGPCPQGM